MTTLPLIHNHLKIQNFFVIYNIKHVLKIILFFQQHYVDLNDTYLRANMDNANVKPTDYLSLMGSPDEMAPAPPRYVNGHILPEIRKFNLNRQYISLYLYEHTFYAHNYLCTIIP